ncbi:DUF4410 domain-containing protein, partial [Thioclava sp. BHET1]
MRPVAALGRRCRIGLCLGLAVMVPILGGCTDTGVSALRIRKGAAPQGAVWVAASEAPGQRARPDLRAASLRVTREVATDLQQQGVTARLVQAGQPPQSGLLLTIAVVEVETGSAMERTLIGFGMGRASISASAVLRAIPKPGKAGKREMRVKAAMAPLQPALAFSASSGTGHMPGVIMPIGMGVAFANAARAVVMTGATTARNRLNTPNLRERRLARAIADQISDHLGGHKQPPILP